MDLDRIYMQLNAMSKFECKIVIWHTLLILSYSPVFCNQVTGIFLLFSSDAYTEKYLRISLSFSFCVDSLSTLWVTYFYHLPTSYKCVLHKNRAIFVLYIFTKDKQ